MFNIHAICYINNTGIIIVIRDYYCLVSIHNVQTQLQTQLQSTVTETLTIKKSPIEASHKTELEELSTYSPVLMPSKL